MRLVEELEFLKDGFKFDNGPTFFHYTEIAEEIFKSLGMDAHEHLELLPIDPNYRLVFGAGGSINASTDLDDVTQQINNLCEENTEGFRRYIEDNRRKLSLSKNCLNSPWRGPLDLVNRRRAMRVAKVLRPWRSVWHQIWQSIFLMSECN